MERLEPTAANLDRRSRRWLQFSIRTLLVLVMLLCVALSMWVVPAERRRRAVAAVEALGGAVIFVDRHKINESSSIVFIRRWLPHAYVDEAEVVDFNFSDTEVTDAGLAHLQGLASLQGLDLSNTQVTDAGLAHLQQLKSIRWLFLRNTEVTDAGVAKLRNALPNCRVYGP
jgi:hypothetical protein